MAYLYNGFFCILLIVSIIDMNLAIEITQVKELPDDIPTCGVSDAHLNECIRNAFQKMASRAKDGVKELNIPPMDPFALNRTSFQYTSNAINGRISLINILIYGLSETTVKDVKFKLTDKKMRLQVILNIPRLFVQGNYKANININNIQMTPKGYINVTISNITLRTHPEGELYERDGHSYLRLTKISADADVGDMNIYASGLFPDPELNDVSLQFVNQYWKEVYKSVISATRPSWEPFIILSFNEIFAALPFDLVLKNI